METIRAYKIPGTDMAAFDWLATMAVAWYLGDSPSARFRIFVYLILAGIFLHLVFDQPTVLNYYLGLSRYPDRKGNKTLGGKP